MQVMLIDDDLSSLKGVHSTLKHQGNHDCVSFQNPVEAVANYDNEKYDAVITDLKMPEMTGIEVLKTLRKKDPDARVFIITGYENSEDAISAVNNGAKGFLTKPLRSENLLSALDDCRREIEEKNNSERHKKQLEEQIQLSQWMEILGKTSLGVIHDFGNLLTSITVSAELIAACSEHIDSDTLESLDMIIDSATRASKLSRDFLDFGRKRRVSSEEIDIAELIRNLSNIIRQMAGKFHVVNIKIDENLHHIHANPSQIEQIILNLISNAQDAILKNGIINLSAENVQLNNSQHLTKSGLASGSYVTITVSDNGHGISTENRKKIFEPFFTTKGMGKGTGFGLVTVKSIIEQLGGGIELDSKVGEGTTFTIYIPAIN